MKNSKTLAVNSAFPVRGSRAPDERKQASTVVTGQSEQRLRLFAGIHKSKKFSIDAAHELFVGLNPSK
jgi:hypothetical protein